MCEADLKTKNPNYNWSYAHLQNSVANEINVVVVVFNQVV